MPIKIAADDILKYIFHYFWTKLSPDISRESSEWQTTHMNMQHLFFLKNKKKWMSSAIHTALHFNGLNLLSGGLIYV